MFDRLQKPFLTVETGEAYQPIRLTYELFDPKGLESIVENLKCIQKNSSPHSWDWFWTGECQDLHFESLDAFKKNAQYPTRLGALVLKDNKLYLNLPSFKRACLAVPFFHKVIDPKVARVHHGDFINKVFAIDERLPHGFTELFKDDELDKVLSQRLEDYHKAKEECEHAGNAEEALIVLAEYARKEAQKKLPYAERYIFRLDTESAEAIFLGFYIFLRSREIVAIKRWFGETGYSVADVVEETVEQVFGGMDIDVIE